MSAAEPASDRFDLALQDGRLHEAPGSLRVRQGQDVVIRWTSDRPVELHLHGYDLRAAVRSGRPAEMAFEAHVSGRFPVEMHGSHEGRHRPVIYLEVYPE